MNKLSAEAEAALALYMAESEIDRDEAVRRILAEWLAARHYSGRGTAPDAGDTKDTVQYPEFMDDASGGAGG